MEKKIINRTIFSKAILNGGLVFVFAFGAMVFFAQTVMEVPFTVGERITYSVSMDHHKDVAYAETYVVSRGALEGGHTAVELQTKIKTRNFVSAAFFLIDETRTTFADIRNGFPLYTKKVDRTSGLPSETVGNYLSEPMYRYDLVTLIYKIRNSGGTGSFDLIDNGNAYTVNAASAGGEKVQTNAGEYDTTLSNIESTFFTEKGISELKVNFSNDAKRIPVRIRFKTSKGRFDALVSSVHNLAPQFEVVPTPNPLPIPRPVTTPTPRPTPTPYIENQPLDSHLSFALGEVLEYRLSSGAAPAGSFRLHARERKQFNGVDSLLIAGDVVTIAPGQQALLMGDIARVQVDPLTLIPRQIEMRFTGALNAFSQTALLDEKTSTISIGGGTRINAPAGTHSLLSLLYAMRSFNLMPSSKAGDPANDVRVSVLWQTQAVVLSMRPQSAEAIMFNGRRVPAQMVRITGNPQIDQLNLRVWLSNDERRLPLRIATGTYQADLVAVSQNMSVPEPQTQQRSR